MVRPALLFLSRELHSLVTCQVNTNKSFIGSLCDHMEDSLSYGHPAIRIGRFFWLGVVLSVFYENIPNI